MCVDFVFFCVVVVVGGTIYERLAVIVARPPQVASSVLTELNIGEFVIKFNHRVLLDAILQISGVPAAKVRTICSAIDKLDKEPWDAVRQEMTVDKGLTDASADKIGAFFCFVFVTLLDLRDG